MKASATDRRWTFDLPHVVFIHAENKIEFVVISWRDWTRSVPLHVVEHAVRHHAHPSAEIRLPAGFMRRRCSAIHPPLQLRRFYWNTVKGQKVISERKESETSTVIGLWLLRSNEMNGDCSRTHYSVSLKFSKEHVDFNRFHERRK